MLNRKLSAVMAVAGLVAMGTAASAIPVPGLRKLTAAKNYPRMVTSTREEIAAHNRVVTTRQVLRRAARPWKLAKRLSAA